MDLAFWQPIFWFTDAVLAGISGGRPQRALKGRSKGVAGCGPTGNKGETAIFLGLLILGGEGGIVYPARLTHLKRVP